MKISLTGRVTLEIDDRVIDEAQLPGRQGRLLFVYLVVAEGRPVPRHELADVLWGDAPPATWEKALTVLASKLRRLLPAPSILTAAFGCYRIELPPGASVDVVEAAAAADAGERALEAGALEEAKVESERAVSLLVRPFLPGEDGDWVEARRRALAHVRERALATLADAGLRTGDTATAGRAAEQLIGLAPLRESGYRRLMQTHAAAGNRAEALSVYERCRQVLADELGAYPSPETEAIYRTLLDLPLAEASAEGLGAFPSAETDGSPPALPTADAAALRGRGRPRRIVAGVAFAVLALAGVSAALVVARDDESGRLAIPGDAVAALDERGRISSTVTVAGPPSQLAVVDDGLWVGTSTGVVRHVALERETVVESVRVGESVDGLAASEDAVWATSAERGAVVRISPETGDVVQSIDVPNGPRGIAVGEGAVWVASLYARTLARIEPRSGLRVWVRPVGGSPIRVAAGAGSVWLSNESDAQVTRIDPRTGRILHRIGVGNAPGAIAVGAGAVWVANTQDGTVSRIDPATNAVVALVTVGDGPADLTASEERVWVANELAGTVVAIDPATNDVVETVETAQRPMAVALAGDRLWIGTRDASISHRGGTLRVAVAELGQTIDQVDYSVLWALNLTGDGLTAYRRSGAAPGTTLVPDLAMSIPAPTDGGRTYTFQVRRGVRYSSGERVGPADFRRALERLFRLSPAPPHYYDALVGADACRRRPATCDLSRGIIADESAWTVTFRLIRPDPNLLHALALPFAHAVAPSAPRAPVTSRGLPATGPYVLTVRLPGRELRFVRNARFEEWSSSARPDGYPDEIVVTAAPNRMLIRGVELGRFDLALVDRTDAATLDRLAARYPSRVRLDRVLGTLLVVLNTKRPPFDSLAARRAVAHALDRETLAHLTSGPRSTEVACQVLPPNFPAFERYCPFTAAEPDRSDDGTWRAPDLAEARRLIDRSGTTGARVVVRTWPQWVAEARHVAALLRELGYRATVRVSSIEEWLRDAYGPDGTSESVQIGLSGWLIDYAAPSTYFDQLRCGAADPSRHCDPAIDRLMDDALAQQAVDPAAADALWAKVDRELTDRAAWIAYGTPRLLRFLGPRAGNYQAHPVWGTLVDQLWVR